MNSLSWLIYLGAASGSASSFFAFLSVIGAALAFLGFIFTLLWSDDSSERIRNKYDGFNVRGQAMWPRGITMLIVFGIISTILPDKSTVYAIAASQVGEQVVKNGDVQNIASDASKALQQWIRKQTDPEPKK